MSTHLDIFRTLRPQLMGIAYRMLGTRADAEDVLHDAWLKWQATDPSEVRSPEAWLKTATTRLAIDRLRRAKVEREHYPGPWLPEPLSQADMSSPEIELERDDDVSIAFLTLLEALSPEERAVFVLHDILDDDYADIAETLGKSQAACRQMVHRARERLTSRRKRYLVDEETKKRMLERFLVAANRGDRDEIIALFASDAVMMSDGGGKALAVRRPLIGAERIAWLWFAIARRGHLRAARRIVTVNGEPAIASFYEGRLHSVATIETDGERIQRFYTIANPDKLRSFQDLVTKLGIAASPT
ncbi:MAG: RNA polymerase sigma factor SigJ [Xanthomonadaceae bacterium]|nr:RNA polymerase sigma factor SigJ [Xanthomonadaceae bacterium]